MSDRTNLNIHITGNLVNAYFICRRKFWLYARQFNPDPDIDLLLIGRIITNDAYRREKKEIAFENIKIDLIKRSEGGIVVCEIKKSSKGINAAIMQLAFYLKRLKEHGLFLKGEILIPRERKRIPFEMNEEIEIKLDRALEEMKEIAIKEIPPPIIRTVFCKNCGFMEFCFT